jgi:hypothetical protein
MNKKEKDAGINEWVIVGFSGIGLLVFSVLVIGIMIVLGLYNTNATDTNISAISISGIMGITIGTILIAISAGCVFFGKHSNLIPRGKDGWRCASYEVTVGRNLDGSSYRLTEKKS